jgi:hypothetical protein
MSYLGKRDAAWDTTEFHRENVEQAHRAASARSRAAARPARP